MKFLSTYDIRITLPGSGPTTFEHNREHEIDDSDPFVRQQLQALLETKKIREVDPEPVTIP